MCSSKVSSKSECFLLVLRHLTQSFLSILPPPCSILTCNLLVQTFYLSLPLLPSYSKGYCCRTLEEGQSANHFFACAAILQPRVIPSCPSPIWWSSMGPGPGVFVPSCDINLGSHQPCTRPLGGLRLQALRLSLPSEAAGQCSQPVC